MHASKRAERARSSSSTPAQRKAASDACTAWLVFERDAGSLADFDAAYAKAEAWGVFDAGAAAPARAAAADTLATSVAADTLVAAEGQRHAERIRRLEFENEELRRATKTKTERINALRRQIAERDAASMLSVSTS